MKNIFYIVVAIVMLSSCKEELEHEPLMKDNIAPGEVIEPMVKNLPGGAEISYKVPDDVDLAYVMAVFNRKGVMYDTRASGYTNKVVIEGLSEETPQKVKLFAVDKSENYSDPIDVTIEPLEPPFMSIYNSIQIIPDFGGAQFAWSNEMESPVFLNLLAEDSTARMKSFDIYYSDEAEGVRALRGFEPEPMRFAAIVGDRWDNYSDTIIKMITPLYETELDKTKFNKVVLGSDSNWDAWKGEYEHLYDGDTKGTFGHTMAGSGWPAVFTIDLGGVKKLSRMKIWQRHDVDYFIYTHGNPKNFTIYGCEDEPEADGSWDNWIKLRDCEVIKPSGLPIGQYNNEDLAAAIEGHEFVFDVTQTPSIRYIRIEVTQNWDGTNYSNISEFSFFGQDLDVIE